ncbi:MAG: flavin reductase family protein [Clostridia bacterium]|nr:flavin reductase family protein [Clostridia bacterium]
MKIDLDMLSGPFFEAMKSSGAFLCVPGNVMTVGWAQLGWIWGKPIMTVLVRPSRHTYDIIEACPEFTLSVPGKGQMKKQLAYAGSASGKDVNKFDFEGLTALASRHVSAPVVAGCEVYAECRSLYKRDMTEMFMSGEIVDKAYPSGDFHRMYFGEILDVYK